MQHRPGPQRIGPQPGHFPDHPPAARYEPYRTRHWVFDNRYNHGHYYPSPGYAIRTLPPGHLALHFSNRRYFFDSGVWYAPAASGFVVVRPPVGIILPVLPPAYSTVVIGGTPYYYADGTYYTATENGYVVTAPPQQETYVERPAPAPDTQEDDQQTDTGTSYGTWYYCDSAQAYYPYVATCPEGWRAVPASPPEE
jgi:hypothetical protein